MREPEMLELLKDAKGKFGAIPNIWQLENTVSEGEGAKNHEWWGFSKCSVCGSLAVYFQQDDGYRCEEHRP